MAKKPDVLIALLKEILAELRRLNANLERRTTLHEMPPKETELGESEDMEEFE